MRLLPPFFPSQLLYLLMSLFIHSVISSCWGFGPSPLPKQRNKQTGCCGLRRHMAGWPLRDNCCRNGFSSTHLESLTFPCCLKLRRLPPTPPQECFSRAVIVACVLSSALGGVGCCVVWGPPLLHWESVWTRGSGFNPQPPCPYLSPGGRGCSECIAFPGRGLGPVPSAPYPHPALSLLSPALELPGPGFPSHPLGV